MESGDQPGALLTNVIDSQVLSSSASGVVIVKTRGVKDDPNAAIAGIISGLSHQCTGSLLSVAQRGLAGLTLASLNALYMNWEHRKGLLLQQSL